MSESENSFGKFVPGFDFLQNLAKGATQAVPQMPNLSNWIAPSLNEEELDKRISELKTVHFWLDQNSKALGATVQALEVQKLTLATLKGMNLSLGEMASAFKFKTPEAAPAGVAKAAEKAEEKAQVKEQAVADQPDAPATQAAAAAGMVDPMQLWTALTQQFQHIAAGAMKEVGKAASLDAGADATAVKPAAKTAKPAAAKKAAGKKVVAKKAAPKTTTRSR